MTEDEIKNNTNEDAQVEETEQDEQGESDIITLVDEDGKEEAFEFIGRIDYKGASYVALVPVKNNEEGEYVLLKLALDENGDETLVTIDDDEEFEAVSDKFEDELFEDIDYDDEEDKK